MSQDPGLTRRRFVELAAASAAAAPLGLSALAQEEGGDETIRSFPIQLPDEDLAELKRRIAKTLWPEKETVPDASQGVQLGTIQKLARYWSEDYDWAAFQKKLKAVPHFMTTIDGLGIHFIHVRSKHENAMPLILTHGWPGSFIEFLKVVDPLTNPTAHGGNASDAFHVVIPSMPGYGFSGKPTSPGWNPDHIARAWVTLMKRLGYTQYGAQGGDWGAVITDLMALQAPPGLMGIHTNMSGVVPPEIDRMAQVGKPAPSGLSPEERAAYERLSETYKNVGYAVMMGWHPQSLTALADSPVGLAAFLIDHDPRSYRMIGRVFDGQSEGLTRDDVLDNATLYWLTNTAMSSARLYWELYKEGRLSYFDAKGVMIPAAVSDFPEEIVSLPRSWAEKAYPKLVYYHKAPKGGHFAAWEQPEIFSEEVRAGFRPMREQKQKRKEAK
jgi:pimeloyl-ACP methyl ester carboxylesterase